MSLASILVIVRKSTIVVSPVKTTVLILVDVAVMVIVGGTVLISG